MRQANRIGWIEWARALGALGVALLHVFISVSLQIVDDMTYARLAVYIDLGIIFGRWAVPAFFMITGYLLLDPKKGVGWSRACKYAMRMIWVLLIFGFAFSLMEEASITHGAGEPITLGIIPAAALDVLTASTWDHLWYIYALVVVYLLVPVVRAVRDWLGERRFRVATIALYVVVLVIPTLVQLWITYAGIDIMLPEGGLVTFLSNAIIGLSCFCIGGLLRDDFDERLAMGAGLVSLIVMLATNTVRLLLMHDGDLGFIFLQGSCFACAYAFAVLVLLRRLLGEKPIRPGSVIEGLAKDSFGIYLLHPLFVHLALMAVDPILFPPGVFELGLFAVVVAASVVATRLLRHVPFVRGLL